MDQFRFLNESDDLQPFLVGQTINTIPTLSLVDVGNTQPEVQAFLTAVAQAESRYLAQSVIYRGDTREDMETVFQQGISPRQFRKWRETTCGCFFLINGAGSHISVVDRRTSSSNQIIALAGYTPEMYKKLEDKDQFPHNIVNTHTDHVTELLNIANGTLVLETGAGLDAKRITRMQHSIKAKGGHLVCHDIPPLLAKVGRERFVGTPYIAVPAFKEFLGTALRAFPGKKVLTAKNTLTSMREFEVEALLDSAEAAEVERVILTQSISPNMALFFADAEKIIDEYILELAIKVAGEHSAHEEYEDIAVIMIKDQIQRFLYTILLEIFYQNFADRAATRGYSIESITESTAETFLSKNEVEALMAEKEMPFDDLFSKGLFNEVTFVPTAILYDKNHSIPKDKLKLRTKQVHLTLSRKHQNGNKLVVGVGGRNLKTLAIPAYARLKRRNPKLMFRQVELDPRGEKYFYQHAASSASAIVFEALGKVLDVNIVRQYCGTSFEAALDKSLGIDVNT